MSFLTVERQIENSLFDFIVESTCLDNTQVFWGETNTIKPKKPYMLISNANWEKFSHSREAGYENDAAIIQSDYEVSFLIRMYRDDPDGNYSARSIMMELSHSLGDREMLYKHFTLNNIGYSRQGNIVDTSIALDNTTYEKRFRMTVSFNVTVQSTSSLATSQIDTVNYDVDVED